MRPLLHALLLLSLSTTICGQELLVLPERDANELTWNPKFIARNGIVEISGKLSVKREGQPMIPKKEQYLFRFDSVGQTIYSNTSYGNPGTGHDTTWTKSIYDKDGRLLRIIRADLGGFFAYSNEFNTDNMLIRQTYSRVENQNQNRYNFEEGNRTEIFDEYYQYERPGSDLLIKKYLNDRQLPYREERFNYNSDGYLIQIESTYLISRKQSRVQLSYDGKGRLEQRVIHGSTGQERHIYEYDETGQLSRHQTWNGTTHLVNEEFLYDKKTGLLSARLTKDMRTGIIRIVKFTHRKSS